MSYSKGNRGLGKGLKDMPSFHNQYHTEAGIKDNSLFRKTAEKPSDPSIANSPKIVAQMAGDIAMIPIGQIEPNKDQPRQLFYDEDIKSLALSIKDLGIIQPITVRKLSALKYQIISGERRFRASQIAGLEMLPAYIREADDQRLLEMALVENVQREDLHPIEVATSYKRLKDECNLTDEAIGKIVGKSRSSVTNQLRYLELPEEIKIALVQKKLTQGHAKALLSLHKNSKQQLLLFNLIKDQGLSVRAVEELSRKAKQKKHVKKALIAHNDEEIRAIDSINNRFNQRVKLKKESTTSGIIEIKYKNESELEKFLWLLENND